MFELFMRYSQCVVDVVDFYVEFRLFYWYGRLAQNLTEAFMLFLCRIFGGPLKSVGKLLYRIDAYILDEIYIIGFRFKDWIARGTSNELCDGNVSRSELEADLEADLDRVNEIWDLCMESLKPIIQFHISYIPIFCLRYQSLVLSASQYIKNCISFAMKNASPEVFGYMETGYLQSYSAARKTLYTI